jgi:uncharacterized protein
MSDIPSPCISICKFRREGRAGDHCIGCSMTEDQKNLFKSLRKKRHQKAFVDLLVHQQTEMGKYAHWAREYTRRCVKKGVTSPLT